MYILYYWDEVFQNSSKWLENNETWRVFLITKDVPDLYCSSKICKWWLLCIGAIVNDLKQLTFLFIPIWWAHIKCWLLLIIICAYRKHKSLTWASNFEKCCLEQYQRHQLLTIEHILHAMRPTDETILGPVQLTFQYKALTKIKLLHLPFTFSFKSRL